MATVTLSRSDLFPVGQSVGIYPGASRCAGGPPTAAVIQSGTVDAAGALSVADAGILAGAGYVAYALVNGEHRYVQLRSTVDKFDDGGAIGTGDTSTGTLTILNASATSGSFREGQIITGPGIPPETRIFTISGATLTLDAKATASASGVALVAYGAFAWKAKVRQRQAALGTS